MNDLSSGADAITPDDVLLLRRELELEKRQLELEKNNRIVFFQPHAKQTLFYANASYHFRYARTGNRFGKSEMGAAEDIAFALGYRPWIPEGDPIRYLGIPSHPTKGLIITTDWDKSKEVFTELEGANKGKLFTYIPPHLLGQPTRNHSGAIDRIPIRHRSGGWSVIHLDTVKSYKQNPMGQESSVWDWVHVDEPCPEGMWKAVSRGLVDRNGRAWFTCTPIAEPWIDEKFVPSIEQQSQAEVGTIEDASASRWMMTGSMDDNPHLTPAAIARFIADLTPEEQEARRYGRPLAYSGVVYKEFSWNDHVLREPPPTWKDWSTPPEDHCIRFAIDFHPRKPHHVLFIATSPLDVHYAYAELFISCLMSELVSEIKAVLKGRECATPGLIDPLASTPNRVTDLSPLDEVLRLELPVMPATKDPHNGILKAKELLKTRDRTKRPVFFVASHLSRFLFEISRGYIWDEDTNKPLKENDDAMENFYRLALQGLPYIEPSGTFDYSPISPRENFDIDLNVSFEDFSFTPKKPSFRASRYRR